VAAEDEQLERVEALLEEPRAVLLLVDLPGAERDAVLPRVVAERPYAEIAAAGATSEQVIRKCLSRALGRLR
jgi:DNA-directed RNA polymerase specialized sigma24 family protein